MLFALCGGPFARIFSLDLSSEVALLTVIQQTNFQFTNVQRECGCFSKLF